jgi:Bacterial Ig-like domain (group 2)
MSSMKQKLRLTGALAVLATLALAVSCKGFFQNPTLSSLTINPTAPNVQVGDTTGLKAFGVYNDGSGGYVTSNVSWSSSDTSVATVTGSGNATLTGVSTGTATITASAQSVTGTATATIFLVITALTISPTSANLATGASQNFTVTADTANGEVDVSASATISPEQSGAAVTTITCTSGSDPIVCTNNSATAGTYQFVASYTGSNLTATANVTVP